MVSGGKGVPLLFLNLAPSWPHCCAGIFETLGPTKNLLSKMGTGIPLHAPCVRPIFLNIILPHSLPAAGTQSSLLINPTCTEASTGTKIWWRGLYPVGWLWWGRQILAHLQPLFSTSPLGQKAMRVSLGRADKQGSQHRAMLSSRGWHREGIKTSTAEKL